MKSWRGFVHFVMMIAAVAFMLLGAGNVEVWADPPSENDVAHNTTRNLYYTDLQMAFDDANANDNIKILKDFSLTKGVDVKNDKIITLDLDGKKISAVFDSSGKYTGDYLIAVCYGGNLTVDDNSTEKTGEIATDLNWKDKKNRDTGVLCGIKMTVKNDDASKAPAKLTVNAGKIQGYQYGISGNGTRNDGTEVTINGGVIQAGTGAESVGIYQPQEGVLTITNGVITGMTGIEVRSGTLTVSGGDIQGTAASYSLSANRNGVTTLGAGISIAPHEPGHGDNRDITATITGGNISGIKAISVSNPMGNGGDSNVLPTNVTVHLSEAFAKHSLTALPEDYVWLKDGDSYIPHKHTYSEPKWRWLRIDEKWTVTSTYTCTDSKCGYTMNLKAGVTESDASPKRYTATDSRDKTDTFSASTYTVTHSDSSSTIEWGKIAKCVGDDPSNWTINWSASGLNMTINRSKEIAFAVTEDTSVSAASGSGTQEGKIVTDLKSDTAKTAVFKAKWSLPEGSQVISAIIYRGTTTTNSDIDANNIIAHGTEYNTGLNVATGDFTLTLTDLADENYQHVTMKIIYILNSEQKTLISEAKKVQIHI